MEELRPESRPCAHCGGPIAVDDTTCAACGRPYIPDAPRTTAPPHAADAPTADSPPPDPPPPGPAPVGPVPAALDRPTDESRMWAMGAHLSALAGLLLGGLPAFLGPLVVWLIRRDARDPFATDHAREALNFNLSVLIYAIVAAIGGVIISIVTLGLALIVLLPLALIAFVGYVVVTVLATSAASRGDRYAYPMTLRLVS